MMKDARLEGKVERTGYCHQVPTAARADAPFRSSKALPRDSDHLDDKHHTHSLKHLHTRHTEDDLEEFEPAIFAAIDDET